MSPAWHPRRRQIFAYSLVVAVVGVLPWLLGYVSAGYGVVAAVLGAGFVWYAWQVLRMADADRVMRPAKMLFAYSLLYLFSIFAAYLADKVHRARAGDAGSIADMELETVKPTEAQLKARRSRSVAIGLALGAFVIVVYVSSLVRMDPAAIEQRF